MNLEGIAITRLCRELNERLAGTRIEKIYQPDRHSFIFHIRGFGENLRLLASLHPEKPCLYFCTGAPENPGMPPAFCMLLRKHLEDGKIAAVTQIGFDRVVCLSIDVRGERNRIDTKQLYIELTGKNSNLIFTHNNTIIDAAKRVGLATSRFRQILPGLGYVLPPPQNKQPLTDAAKHLQLPDLPLAKALLQTIGGIGMQTAAFLCRAAGLPPDINCNVLDNADIRELNSALEFVNCAVNSDDSYAAVAQHDSKLLKIAPYPLDKEFYPDAELHLFPALTTAIEAAARLTGNAPGLPEKSRLTGIVNSEIQRLKNKLALLQKDLADCGNAGYHKLCGDILLTYGFMVIGRPAKTVLPDLYNEGHEIEINLDQRVDAAVNARLYYNRYNKLQRAQIHLEKQIALTTETINYLESISASIFIANCRADLEPAEQELSEAGLVAAPRSKRKLARESGSDPLKFVSPNGYQIYVGKNNRQNDYVTFRLAAPGDLWFHTKDIPGSHVILKCSGNTADTADIEYAAQLAARFSKARESSKVPVDYTVRKQVKKPAGAKPGFVIYFEQKTIMAEPAETVQ